MDEAADHGAALVSHLNDPEEATVETRGFVSQAILHQADPGESRDVGHRGGRGRRCRRQGFEWTSSTTATETSETTEDRGQSGRELLLLLANATIRLCSLQSVDIDCETKSAGTTGCGASHVARMRRFHGSCVLSGCGCAVSYWLPRARVNGVQQQETGRSLSQVQVVHFGLASVGAARSASSEPG